MKRTFSFLIFIGMSALVISCASLIVFLCLQSPFSNDKLLAQVGVTDQLSTITQKSVVWLWAVDLKLESTIYTQSANFAQQVSSLLLASRN